MMPTEWPSDLAPALAAALFSLAVIGQIAVWSVHAVWVAFHD